MNEELEAILGVQFQDTTLLTLALTHRSYIYEAPGEGQSSNERMEFLGDSILGCITAAWLYEQFAEEPEGALTLRKAAIVNDATLAQSARRLGFSGLLRLGAGMRSAGGTENTSVLADAFEAFVGRRIENNQCWRRFVKEQASDAVRNRKAINARKVSVNEEPGPICHCVPQRRNRILERSCEAEGKRLVQ